MRTFMFMVVVTQSGSYTDINPTSLDVLAVRTVECCLVPEGLRCRTSDRVVSVGRVLCAATAGRHMHWKL